MKEKFTVKCGYSMFLLFNIYIYIFPKSLKASHWLSKTNKSNLYDFPSGHGKFPDPLHQFIQEVANTVILLMEEILHQLICFSSTNPFEYDL